MLITRAKTFDEIRHAFRWQLPERMNIATAVCDRHASQRPDSVALLHEHGDGKVATFSFRDVQRLANQCAHMFEQLLHLQRGDRVMIYLGQDPATAVAHVACWKAGLVSVPTSLLFGTDALEYRLRDSGAKALITDAAYLPMVASSNIALVQGLEQNGVEMKFNALMTGYGQPLLDSAAAKTLKPNTYFMQTYKPVEVNDTATKQFQADLKKVGITGVPDYGKYTGYITCDLAITALEQMGKNVTREDFAPKFRELGEYDAAGLNCRPYPVGLDSFGKFPETGCIYGTQVKNGKFVVINKGKPVIGKLVGDPAALEANRTGNPLVTTTVPAS